MIQYFTVMIESSGMTEETLTELIEYNLEKHFDSLNVTEINGVR